jgi:hypothetical protein
MPYNAIQIYTPNARCLIGTITFTANIKPHGTPEGASSAFILHALEWRHYESLRSDEFLLLRPETSWIPYCSELILPDEVTQHAVCCNNSISVHDFIYRKQNLVSEVFQKAILAQTGFNVKRPF